MKFSTDSFADGGAIPAHFAFAVPNAEKRIALGPNRNPHLAWSELPKGAQSVVIPDVGHSAYWEQPDTFNRAVLEFVRRY